MNEKDNDKTKEALDSFLSKVVAWEKTKVSTNNKIANDINDIEDDEVLFVIGKYTNKTIAEVSTWISQTHLNSEKVKILANSISGKSCVYGMIQLREKIKNGDSLGYKFDTFCKRYIKRG